MLNDKGKCIKTQPKMDKEETEDLPIAGKP